MISLWSTTFLLSSKIIENYGPFVQKRFNILNQFLSKKYIVLYELARQFVKGVRDIEKTYEEELFVYFSLLHDEQNSHVLFAEKVQQLTQKSHPNLFPKEFSDNAITELFITVTTDAYREKNLLYYHLVEILKKELNDECIIRQAFGDSIFSSFCDDLCQNYISSFSTTLSDGVSDKVDKIMHNFEVVVNNKRMSCLNKDKVTLMIQTLFKIRLIESKDLRTLLCYKAVYEIHIHIIKKDLRMDMYAMYLFYMYYLKKITESWLGNFLTNTDTFVSDKTIPRLLKIMLSVKSEYEEIVKNHPHLSTRKEAKRELKRKSSGVTSNELYETIPL